MQQPIFRCNISGESCPTMQYINILSINAIKSHTTEFPNFHFLKLLSKTFILRGGKFQYWPDWPFSNFPMHLTTDPLKTFCLPSASNQNHFQSKPPHQNCTQVLLWSDLPALDFRESFNCSYLAFRQILKRPGVWVGQRNRSKNHLRWHPHRWSLSLRAEKERGGLCLCCRYLHCHYLCPCCCWLCYHCLCLCCLLFEFEVEARERVLNQVV